MPKASKTFRLSPQALDHLETLKRSTGSTQTAILEQALAVYSTLLEQGTLPTVKRWADKPPQPAHPKPRAPAAKPAPTPSGNPHEHTVNGRTYHFGFPVAELPKHGSDPCPCGSGKRFNGCHTDDFRLAIKADLTARD